MVCFLHEKANLELSKVGPFALSISLDFRVKCQKKAIRGARGLGEWRLERGCLLDRELEK